MESNKNKVALVAAVVVVIVVAIYVGIKLLGPTPVAWPGTVGCSPRLPCNNPSGIACINFTGECRSGVCVERLAADADCAAGWIKESTAGATTVLAKCDTTAPDPVCKWQTPVTCGVLGGPCCATGRCGGTLVCKATTCQNP